MKIKTGDKIKVLTGKDKGKEGKILQVFPLQQRASVEGVNVMIKQLRSQKGRSGQKVEFPAPLHMSNLLLLCPKCGKGTRGAFKILENKKKVRVCRKCGETI